MISAKDELRHVIDISGISDADKSTLYTVSRRLSEKEIEAILALIEDITRETGN